MSGATIGYTFDSKDFEAAVARLSGGLSRGVMRAIGTGLVEVVNQRFESQTEPFGPRWHALLPAYAEIKRGPRILTASGQLQRSITFAVSGNTVAVGSNRVYAAVHQFGAVITVKNAKALRFRLGAGVVTGKRGGKSQGYALVRVQKVTIPARPYLGFGPADQRSVMETVAVFINRELLG